MNRLRNNFPTSGEGELLECFRLDGALHPERHSGWNGSGVCVVSLASNAALIRRLLSRRRFESGHAVVPQAMEGSVEPEALQVAAKSKSRTAV